MKIKFENVCKKYGEIQVLDNLNFEIHSNCINAIVGKNGAGKTTLIKGLSTLLVFDKGIIDFFGDKFTKDNHNFFRNKISLALGDSKNLYLNLTVIENIKYFLAIHKNRYESKKQLIEHYLSIFNLNNHKNRVVSKLSKGMRQKLSIVISLVKDSKVLIFDEPDIGLDIESMKILKQILNKEKKKKTIIITSHNLNLIKDVTDKLIVLDNGKIKYSGYMNNFINNLNKNTILIEIHFKNALSNESKKIINKYSESIEFSEKSFFITIKKENINDILKFLLSLDNKIVDIRSKDSFEDIIEKSIIKSEVTI